MIKIHKKLWFVKGVGRDDNLAYMCQYEEGKDGEPLANISKMQVTGRSWAGKRETKYKMNEKGDYERDELGRAIVEGSEYKSGEEAVIDNSPVSDVYIGSSVARWSTSNKLFRVQDPRGFTVEVPTDNIATLLHHTTVKNGVVQEPCVWGRDGNNHILLPVNSEPYLETLGKMDTLANKLISVSELKIGDWVKMFEDPTEYYYVGKVKGTWSIRGHSYETNWSFTSYGQKRDHRYGDWVEFEDDKWVHLFLRKCNWRSDDSKVAWNTETPSKPKIVEVLGNEPMGVDVETIYWYCPQRICNKAESQLGGWMDFERKLSKLEVKK